MSLLRLPQQTTKQITTIPPNPLHLFIHLFSLALKDLQLACVCSMPLQKNTGRFRLPFFYWKLLACLFLWRHKMFVCRRHGGIAPSPRFCKFLFLFQDMLLQRGSNSFCIIQSTTEMASGNNRARIYCPIKLCKKVRCALDRSGSLWQCRKEQYNKKLFNLKSTFCSKRFCK